MKQIKSFDNFNTLKEGKIGDAIHGTLTNLAYSVSDTRIAKAITYFLSGSKAESEPLFMGLDKQKVFKELAKIEPQCKGRDIQGKVMQDYILNTLVPLIKKMK